MGSSVATLLLSLVIFALVPLARPLTALAKDSSPEVRYLLILIGFGILSYFFRIWKREREHLPIISSRAIRGIIALTTVISSSVALFICITPIEYCHIPMYGALGFLATGHVFKATKNSSSLLVLSLKALLICALVSLLDEMLQGLHPERFFDYRDLLLNGLSSIAGISIRLLVCTGTSSPSEPQNL